MGLILVDHLKIFAQGSTKQTKEVALEKKIIQEERQLLTQEKRDAKIILAEEKAEVKRVKMFKMDINPMVSVGISSINQKLSLPKKRVKLEQVRLKGKASPLALSKMKLDI